MDPIHHIHIWDWKDQPNWESIQKSVQEIVAKGETPHFYEPETWGDDYAVLISNKQLLDQAVIDILFNEWEEDIEQFEKQYHGS